MATIYNVQLVSHWESYSAEQLEKLLQDAIDKIEKEKCNAIQIRVIDKE